MCLVPGLGLRSCHRLLSAIAEPDFLESLDRRDLAQFSIPSKVADGLLSRSSEERAETEWDRASTLDIRIIDIRDPGYPRLLLETFDPPIVLYVREEQCDPTMPHLAIVGARKASAYGVNCTERLAADLAARGIVVASGLARGIDTAAHRGALSEGHSVAVCGTGLDQTYPSENRKLADSIASNGALLSEFPLGTPPLPSSFPLRNRILAGMTLGTIVVEARERSGSLITARLALEANREVFAVPGPIHSSKSVGPHRLIRQGACLVTGWHEVVDELPVEVRQLVSRNQTIEVDAPALTDPQRRIRDILSPAEETAIDTLLSKLDLAPSEVYSALLELELLGEIRQLPGDRYVRKLSSADTERPKEEPQAAAKI